MASASNSPRVAVIGAGAFGAWTAHQLCDLGARVTLIDAWGPGNSRASSGGETRVIRAIYGGDRIYSEMVRRSYELWEQLDSLRQDALYTETGALWMLREADSAYVQAALPILESLGFAVDEPDLDAARRRWPQIQFEGVRKLYLERRAGTLSARRSCRLLRDRLVGAGGVYQTSLARPGTSRGGKLQQVALADGSSVEADQFVFACGPWLGRLFPQVIGSAIRPTRQEVFYFGAPAGSDRYRPGQLPVWIDFGPRIFYGLPDTHGRGFKLADDTRGEEIDPSELNRQPGPEAVERAREFLAVRFPELADAPILESRVCQYENSPDGHLILDRHPELDNVFLAGGGSGHGFKLSPAVGELAARAIIKGAPLPEVFSIGRLARLKPVGTQFDQ
ncbi:MAG: FAD-dependent oxidoreductase [Xanthomonadales bacterium]|nr:FAD-dependent oxidoreductase [Xanthomonadales bacterium]